MRDTLGQFYLTMFFVRRLFSLEDISVVTVLEIRNKWWMDKCPSGDILGHTIPALLRCIFLGMHINNSVTALCVCVCVCVSNEQLVVLSQMSDPNFFGSDKCQNGRKMSEC